MKARSDLSELSRTAPQMRGRMWESGLLAILLDCQAYYATESPDALRWPPSHSFPDRITN